MSEATVSDLLDADLNDLADLPEFKSLKDGTHKATINFAVKEINKKQAVEVKVKLVETLELVDTAEEVDAAGTESSVAYMLDNEFGQGNLKELLKPLGAHHGLTNLRAIMEASQGMEVTITTKKRKDKEDSTKFYFGIKNLVV